MPLKRFQLDGLLSAYESLNSGIMYNMTKKKKMERKMERISVTIERKKNPKNLHKIISTLSKKKLSLESDSKSI